MPGYLPLVKREFKLVLETYRDDKRNARDSEYFRPSGTQVYVGRQGSGKTVSAVHHVNKLKARYPKAILVTNLNYSRLKAIDVDTIDKVRAVINHPQFDATRYYLRFSSADSMHAVLMSVNNDKYGVIYLIDEIQTYLNALDSKNVPMSVFTEISQQRKQRKVIIGTSQLFMRMAKPLREQCDNLIMCTTSFGVLTKQRAYDAMTLEQDYNGQLIGDVRGIGFFIQTRYDRESFDTYQKIISSTDQYLLENIQAPLRFADKKGRKLKIT